MIKYRMGKRNGSSWSGRGLLSMLAGLVLVLGLSTCKVIEETDNGDTPEPGLTGMNFILVTAGTFQMGSPTAELGRLTDEPQHTVTITKDFHLQDSEVTQEQWLQIMGNNPSTNSSCPQCPVENVSWNDVQTFIAALADQEQKTFRLPTEAEWEYAARAGGSTAFFSGDISEQTCEFVDNNLEAIGWYCFNSKVSAVNVSHAVKGKINNNFNMYDMSGNVAEWVQDWYGDYDAGPDTDPTGPATGSNRVVRGGGFKSLPPQCRSAARASFSPSFQGNDLGFRLVWEP